MNINILISWFYLILCLSVFILNCSMCVFAFKKHSLFYAFGNLFFALATLASLIFGFIIGPFSLTF